MAVKPLCPLCAFEFRTSSPKRSASSPSPPHTFNIPSSSVRILRKKPPADIGPFDRAIMRRRYLLAMSSASFVAGTLTAGEGTGPGAGGHNAEVDKNGVYNERAGSSQRLTLRHLESIMHTSLGQEVNVFGVGVFVACICRTGL